MDDSGICYSSIKDSFSAKFPHLNISYYSRVTQNLLSSFYPKSCPDCGLLLTENVGGRENAIRCPKCHYQGSRTSYTPLHHFKLPLWVFSYVLIESIHAYPNVVSSAAIERKLGVSNKTALLLKRRLQLFLGDLLPAVKDIIKEDITASCKRMLPQSGDLSERIANKPVVYMDTLALFSATQRANGGRKRHKHTGQTASIYLTDQIAEKRGKYQIGSLCHTLALKNGPVILSSIPDQKTQTIFPQIEFLPKKTIIFTDEGYPPPVSA
jgi:transposase-like protein